MTMRTAKTDNAPEVVRVYGRRLETWAAWDEARGREVVTQFEIAFTDYDATTGDVVGERGSRRGSPSLGITTEPGRRVPLPLRIGSGLLIVSDPGTKDNASDDRHNHNRINQPGRAFCPSGSPKNTYDKEGNTMRKATENMTPETRRAYYATRKPFLPEIGATYENEGGGVYIVLDSIRHGVVNGRAHAVVKNTRSGWVCTAHGVGIYEDGAIDWDGSTDGYFDGEDAREIVKKREFITRLAIKDATAAIRLLPEVPRGDLLPLAGLYPTYAADLLRSLVEGNDSNPARRVRRAADDLEKIAAKY